MTEPTSEIRSLVATVRTTPIPRAAPRGADPPVMPEEDLSAHLRICRANAGRRLLRDGLARTVRPLHGPTASRPCWAAPVPGYSALLSLETEDVAQLAIEVGEYESCESAWPLRWGGSGSRSNEAD